MKITAAVCLLVGTLTTLGNSEPPSAPKADPVKSEKVMREAKVWEAADYVEYIQEEAELEVAIENVYNGDDWQEAVADAVLDTFVEPVSTILCCCCKWKCCLCCNNICCCADDAEVDEYEGEQMQQQEGVEMA